MRSAKPFLGDMDVVSGTEEGTITDKEIQCGTGGLELKIIWMEMLTREGNRVSSKDIRLEVCNPKTNFTLTVVQCRLLHSLV